MKANEKVKFLREAKNFSQEKMAAELHMSTNGYAKIERGESRLTISKLEQISTVLGVDVLELMSLGESNILLFQEKDNVSFINSSQELAAEIRQLKQALAHKEEIIDQKNTLLEAHKRENELLRKQLGL